MTKKKESSETIDEINELKECFIITPIGAFGSEVYNKAMGLIDAVIDPVLRELDMCAMPANRMPDLGSINKQLIKRVIEDELVIANLTGLNPNVMYELAIRHGARKPVIIMAEEGTRLPFDITDQRAIFYTDTFSGVEQAKEELRKKISFALDDETPDNPIYSYLQSAQLFKEVKADDPLKAVLAKIESLTQQVPRNIHASQENNFSTNSYQNVEWRIKGYFKHPEDNNVQGEYLKNIINAHIYTVMPNIKVKNILFSEDGYFEITIIAQSTKDIQPIINSFNGDKRFNISDTVLHMK